VNDPPAGHYSAIAAFAQRALRERSVSALGKALLDALCETAGGDACALLVARRGGNEAEVVRRVGFASARRTRIALADGTLYAEALAKNALVARRLDARDADADPEIAANGFRAALVAPVTIGSDSWMVATFRRRGGIPRATFAPAQALVTIFAAALARRRAEERLDDRERTLRLLFEQIPAIVWTIDRRLIVTSSRGGNPLLPRGVGRSLAELGFTPDSLAMHAVHKALAGESGNYELEYSGTVFANRVEPLRDENGEISGAIGVAFDITERSRALEELRASREELRRLAAHLRHVQENERRRIARELHDELGQRLTAIHYELANTAELLRDGDDDAAAKTLATASSLVQASMNAVRNVATQLRPGTLDDFGFRAAVEQEVAAFATRTGIDASLRFDGLDDQTLHPDLATALYRIVQEALTNVARHAAATHVDVSIDRNDSHVVAEVRDNGRGITREEIESGRSIGLTGLRERAFGFGGTVNIEGNPGAGTSVRVRVPMAGGEGTRETADENRGGG
jgi:signal transduction histidine kinase